MKNEGKKGKNKDKNIILFIVEGESDKIALEFSIQALFDRLNPAYEVVFSYMQRLVDKKGNDAEESDQSDYIEYEEAIGGDITSFRGTTLENIEDRITKFIYVPALKEHKFYAGNICKVFQIVDMDGAFILDENIIEGGTRTYYDPNNEQIVAPIVSDIQERNLRKRNNLKYLLSLKEIKIKTKLVPYSLYYFSSNLDHFIDDEINREYGKKRAAENFSDRFIGDPDGFVDFFAHNSYSVPNDTNYSDSWNHIMENNNSIKRGTNLNLLLQDIINGEVPPPEIN